MSSNTHQMLPFILSNLPDEWDKNVTYNDKIYIVLHLNNYGNEYRKVKELILPHNIKCVCRVQNPFQYGRFKLRQELLGLYSVVKKL